MRAAKIEIKVMSSSSCKKIVLAVSGASGAIYARRVLEQLISAGCQVHIIFTDMARRIMETEQRISYQQLR